MLKKLIEKYGKEKINTITKYPSILTLHEFGGKGRFTKKLTTNISHEKMYATEKIDGTNVRIVCFGDKYLVGSRNNILHYCDDFYWDESMDIVNQFFELEIKPLVTDKLTIVFGELFGGKTSAKSKNYGKDKYGFRVFDVAEVPDLSILEKTNEELSLWRESTNNSILDNSLRYGQEFVDLDRLKSFGYSLVPSLEFKIDDFDHESILEALNDFIPTTKVALSESAQLKSEGVVLRNFDRSKIVKLRFEDYIRTLKHK